MAEATQLPDGPSAAAAPRDDEAAAALESFLGDELKAKVQDWCATETAELSKQRAQLAQEKAAAEDAMALAREEIAQERATLQAQAAELRAGSDQVAAWRAMAPWMRSSTARTRSVSRALHGSSSDTSDSDDEFETSRAEADGDVIQLNVGGKLFTTTRATLCTVADSPLAAMVLRWELPRDQDGVPFLDRDPAVFEIILQCLRNPGLEVRDVAIAHGVSTSVVCGEMRYLGLDEHLGCEGTPVDVLKDVSTALGEAAAADLKRMVDNTFATVA
jgi:hypothetical protein